MPRFRHLLGVTLLELLVAMIIIAIVAVMASAMLGNAFRATLVGTEAARDAQQAQLALERMTRELRTVRSASAADLTPAANQITFVEAPSGAIINYALSGTTLNRSEAGTAYVLADNIGALAFTYLQSDGSTVTFTPNLVYFITVQLTVSSQNISASYGAAVKPTGF